MFTKIYNGSCAVLGKNSCIIFNPMTEGPVLVNHDFFERIMSKQLSAEDKQIALENGFDFDTDDSVIKKDYLSSIDSYINNYRGPEVLDLMISEVCNLRCPMCIHGYARDTFSKTMKKLMDWETAKSLIDFYAKEWAPENDLKILSFHFGVAEPLLNKTVLKKSLEYIGENYGQQPFEIMINTNLTLLDDELVYLFKKHKVFISVGLDGEKSSNDSMRVDALNRGTFDIIINNISRLTKAGIPVGVAITLTNHNFHEVNPERFLRLMKSIGINSVLVDPDVIQGLECPAEELVNKLIDFQKTGDLLDIEIRGDWKAALENLTSTSPDPGAFCASILGKNISISPSGKLLFCCYSSKVIAERQLDPRQAFKIFTERMRNYMDTYWKSINSSACGDCPLLGSCAGGCHITREQVVGVKYMCEVYQRSTALLLQYYYGDEEC